MASGKTTRLSKAAREFNVGLSTIVDFLGDKGYDVEANPNTKITAEQYDLLVSEYSSDGKVKKESEQVSLSQTREVKNETITIKDVEEGGEPVSTGKSEEDEVLIKNVGVSARENLMPEPKVVGKIDLDQKPKKEEPKEPEETKEDTPVELTESASLSELKNQDKEVKVLGKIDLDSINQKTRPDKKPKAEKTREKDTPKSADASADSVKKDEVIKAKAGKLGGPNVVGKMELPISSSDDDRKRKRKRIQKVDVGSQKPTNKGGQNQRKGGKPGKSKSPKQEVSDEDVEKQIKDTLARLTSKTKSKGAKYRREKREAVRQEMEDEEAKQAKEKNIIKVTEFVSVAELASMMDAQVNDIISTCMGLGLFVSINQRLDAETMALVADEFGFKVEFVSAEVQEAITEEEDKEEDLVARPPIVTVMGHVDHGKTKLLDHIRSANVIAGEAGGITQHIGAYNVEISDGRHITFLDTPGHEAFTAMRARGAQITDVAIIVVAADDGVKPQTVEAINHAHAAGVPIVFAINKIDKPTANPDKVKEELSQMNFMVEEWGGKYQSQEISAKSGLNIDELLEKVLLEAELLDLKANPEKKAVGAVIESSLDKGRGYTSTILVEAGTLQKGDVVLAGSYYGHVKAMFNERGNQIDQAGPATPVLILGLNGAPQAGDQFNVMESDKEAREIANKREQLQREQGIRAQKHITLDEIGRRIAIGNFQELNVIVKGDVDGSVEALSDSLIKLSNEEIQVNIIHKGVGQISETDVMLAAASDAIVLGFQVRPSASAKKQAEKEEIDIRIYSIIYDAIDEIKAAMEGMLSPEIREEAIATVEVLETFKITKVGTIAGCMVTEGKITRDAKVRVIRDGIVVHTGELGSLKRFKDDVKEVVSGLECGLDIENYNDIVVGDVIEAFRETEIRKKL